MVRGTLLTESLRVGQDLRVPDLVVTRIGDPAGQAAAVQYGLTVGTPAHQLDRGE
jgi:hypothetical protein